MNDFEHLVVTAQEQAKLQERLRIAKEYEAYARRSEIPLEIQKDLAKIIMVDIVFTNLPDLP